MADSTPKSNGFFSRWSQRREQVAAEEAALANQTTAEKIAESTPTTTVDTAIVEPAAIPPNAQDALPRPDEDPNRILTAEDLPNPEEIEIGGSFAKFMGANVDPAAKTAALRALWKQPHFNEIDGLLEYALDYSNQPKLTPEVSAELAQKVFRQPGHAPAAMSPTTESAAKSSAAPLTWRTPSSSRRALARSASLISSTDVQAWPLMG